MNLNIDFSFLYIADVVENLKELTWLPAFAIVVCIIAIIFLVIAQYGSEFNEEDQDDVRIYKMLSRGIRTSIIIMIISIVLAILSAFLPSKETIYAMGIGNNIINNQNQIVDTIEGTVDYIVDAADKLIHGESEVK